MKYLDYVFFALTIVYSLIKLILIIQYCSGLCNIRNDHLFISYPLLRQISTRNQLIFVLILSRQLTLPAVFSRMMLYR